MSDVYTLIGLLEASQSGRVDLKAFVARFESLYWSLSEAEVTGDSEAWLAINDLAEHLEYFDPENHGEPGLFGETKLRELIGKTADACKLSNN